MLILYILFILFIYSMLHNRKKYIVVVIILPDA